MDKSGLGVYKSYDQAISKALRDSGKEGREADQRLKKRAGTQILRPGDTVVSSCRRYRYHVSIIDYLGTYDYRKKLET